MCRYCQSILLKNTIDSRLIICRILLHCHFPNHFQDSTDGVSLAYSESSEDPTAAAALAAQPPAAPPTAADTEADASALPPYPRFRETFHYSLLPPTPGRLLGGFLPTTYYHVLVWRPHSSDESSVASRRPWAVCSRRYSDFVWLCKQLR